MGFDQFPQDADDKNELLEREREEALAEEEHDIFWQQLMQDERASAEALHRDSAAARVEAHRWFDLIWKGEHLSRKAAYAWLRKELGVSRDGAHIARFDEKQCRRVVELVKAFLARQQGTR